MDNNLHTLYPLTFVPVYRDYIWGGTRLADLYGRAPSTPQCAESWELVDRDDGMSIVRNGPLAGTSLSTLMQTRAEDLVGTSGAARFPLLVKILDATQDLSIQVHPSDDTAPLTGGEPKSEAWYILEAGPDACIYAGLKAGTNSAALTAAVAEERVLDIVHRLPVRRGDAFEVPGGLVHSIGRGCLLLEIQQNSNTTYRVYDWGRTGTDGNPRELHMDKAGTCIDWDRPPPAARRSGSGEPQSSETPLVLSPHFRIYERALTKTWRQEKPPTEYEILFVCAGEARIAGGGIQAHLSLATTCLVPAAVSSYTVEPLRPDTRLVRVRPPAC